MYCSNQVYGVKPDLLVFTINYCISVLLLVFTTIFYIKVMLGDNIFFSKAMICLYARICNFLQLFSIENQAESLVLQASFASFFLTLRCPF